MRIAIIGRGSVGSALAPGLAGAGHDVRVGARDPEDDATPPQLPVDDAVDGAEVVILAVPYGALEAVAEQLRPRVRGAVVVDCTNPIGDGLVHAPGERLRSGGEAARDLFPESAVVKAFATVGAEAMRDPVYDGRRAFMPVCGDDADARAVAVRLAEEIGCEAVDVGGMEKAVHLEHLALLWITMAHQSGLGRYFAMGLLGVADEG